LGRGEIRRSYSRAAVGTDRPATAAVLHPAAHSSSRRAAHSARRVALHSRRSHALDRVYSF